jgi:spore germination protein GerM
MTRRVLSLTLFSIVAIVLTACGVPQNSDVERLSKEGDNDRFGLALATTSTTTTTTTTVPTTTSPDLSTTTSSTIPVPTTAPPELAKLYFVANDELFEYRSPIVPGATRKIIIDELVNGVPAEATGTLQTLLPLIGPDSIRDLTDAEGVAFLDLAQPFYDQIIALTPGEQALAFGQLVMTALLGEQIGTVVFKVEGVDSVVVDGNGSNQNPGQPMSYDDYAILLAEQ